MTKGRELDSKGDPLKSFRLASRSVCSSGRALRAVGVFGGKANENVAQVVGEVLLDEQEALSGSITQGRLVSFTDTIRAVVSCSR